MGPAGEGLGRANSLPRLRPYQAEAARAIVRSAMRRDGMSFSIEIARQGGKNELSAQVELMLLALNQHRHATIIKCAPTFRPQAQLSLRRLWARAQQAGMAPPARLEEGRAVRLGRASVLFLSAEPGANVVGHTAELLLEVDEAQDVDGEYFDLAFRPMAASTAATTVYYGTAWDETTLLARMRAHHQELERADGIRRHFAYDWRVVAAYNAAYARYVEAERARLGEDHPLFRTQYLLQPLGAEGRLLSARALRALAGDHARQHGRASGEIYVAGFDPAGEAAVDADASSHDCSVLAIARVRFRSEGPLADAPSLEVVDLVEWRGARYDELYAEVAEVLDRSWHVAKVSVDATGLGGPAARFLERRLGAERVDALALTAQRKSDLGYELLSAANTGRLRLFRADGSPQYRACLWELERARVEYRADRRMRFFVPETEGHDDYLMSLALAVQASARTRPPAERVARGSSRAPSRARGHG